MGPGCPPRPRERGRPVPGGQPSATAHFLLHALRRKPIPSHSAPLPAVVPLGGTKEGHTSHLPPRPPESASPSTTPFLLIARLRPALHPRNQAQHKRLGHSPTHRHTHRPLRA